MQNLHPETPIAVLRNAVVTLLRAMPEFARVSRRLLADLVEHAGVVRVTHEQAIRSTPFLLVVLQGPLVVTPAGSVEHGAATRPIVLRRGVHWADEAPLQPVAAQGVELRAQRARPAYVVQLDKPTLQMLLNASPALAAVDAFRRHFSTADLVDARTELIWMALAPSLRVPLEALTQLLAAAVGAQFAAPPRSAEPAGVVTLAGGTATLAVWRDHAFDAVPLGGATKVAAIVACFQAYVDQWWPGRSTPERLFFVSPGDSTNPPADLAGQEFHRVVYVTDREPEIIPHGLETLLRHALHCGDPRTAGTAFSSFIASLVVPPHASPASGSWLASVARALPRYTVGGFRSVPLDQGAPIGAASRLRCVRERLRKDHCRLAFDLAQLTRDWQRWLDGSISAPSFPTYAFSVGPSDDTSPCQETAYRWARAVTNRRVGVALSGGGACAYRALPLIQMLRRRGVPIDLFSGASGGSLIGAYYCAQGLAGLRHARRRGPAFFLASLGATLWSGIMELQVDRDLGCRRVEDLEVIFLPVTTALGDPPAASVVVGGTLGEAVRASGSALFAFGPTRKGALRYADGSTATMIPAKVLSDHGADLVLACNCIPGPRYGNPFGDHMLGRIAYTTPIVGRIIDTWVASSYLLTTASRMAGTDAQVYWEPSSVWDPLFEAPHFDRANDIVADSLETDGAVMREVTTQMYELWTGLGR